MGVGRGLATEHLGRIALVVEASTAPGKQVEAGIRAPVHPQWSSESPLGDLHADSRGPAWDGRVILVCEGTSWKKFKLPVKVGQCFEMLHKC